MKKPVRSAVLHSVNLDEWPTIDKYQNSFSLRKKNETQIKFSNLQNLIFQGKGVGIFFRIYFQGVFSGGCFPQRGYFSEGLFSAGVFSGEYFLGGRLNAGHQRK